MANDFVICVRDVKAGAFIPEPGQTRFLRVPAGETPSPTHAATRQEDKRKWIEAVLAAAAGSKRGTVDGDILVFIHGYNNSPSHMIEVHRRLNASLQTQGYRGALISYDWPSAESALNYLEDRVDAKLTALRLVTDCISLFAHYQQPDCRINVHLLAHSMGAYVIREAFDDADDRANIAAVSWTVSQIMLVAADISSDSLAAGNPKSSSLYRHCIRLTNYWNPFDAVLSLANVKRIGVAPRAGRIGLPMDLPAKAVDVDCGNYYQEIAAGQGPGLLDIYSHSWFVGDAVFAQDAVLTMAGEIDRNRFPTREGSNNRLTLKRP
jgi:esterase/lipase superfamily enzyme